MPEPKCKIYKGVRAVIESIHTAHVLLHSKEFKNRIKLRRKQLVNAGFSTARLREGNQLVVDVRHEADSQDLNVSIVISYNGNLATVGVGKRRD